MRKMDEKLSAKALLFYCNFSALNPTDLSGFIAGYPARLPLFAT